MCETACDVFLMRSDVKKIVHCASESAEYSVSMFRRKTIELTVRQMITYQNVQERRSDI